MRKRLRELRNRLFQVWGTKTVSRGGQGGRGLESRFGLRFEVQVPGSLSPQVLGSKLHKQVQAQYTTCMGVYFWLTKDAQLFTIASKYMRARIYFPSHRCQNVLTVKKKVLQYFPSVTPYRLVST
jgi:hypothetical protein